MRILSTACAVLLTFLSMEAAAEPLAVSLRHQQETSDGSGRYHTLTRQESWEPQQTAIILCDVWDTHNCKNAAMRVNELVPRLNQVVEKLRAQGVTVLHAPSNCMDFYEESPARLRAAQIPMSNSLPDEITSWCYQIPAEEKGVYPIDQSDGGCDDDPEEHKQWQASLAPRFETKKWPWIRQHEGVRIDEEKDYITCFGDETWSILEKHGIQNVILAGVHTNMCVLGRPFGLRQMSKNGKNVVLMRDLTDTMYNPAMAPYVSHFTGTDLIVSHIEKFVCPTITSNQIVGGNPFRFSGDQRPHLVIVSAEDEYQTEKTLPPFAIEHLGKDFRVSLVFGDEENRNGIPGLEVLDHADALLVSVRRRVLPSEQMQRFRRFAASGKPMIGIRTASHAFSLRNMDPPEGFEDWKGFDPEVWGGNYTNHHGNKLIATIRFAEEAVDHPIVSGLTREEFESRGSLYKVSPLEKGTNVLLIGSVPEAKPEPVAWTFTRADGGKSFYTSLGHVQDFENPVFQKLLANGIRWAAGISPSRESDAKKGNQK